ncbi:unnamed protein product [Symbiodinium sp. KB8]|nr:unnamed protein product [Symbiodinium sp. KB8]
MNLQSKIDELLQYGTKADDEEMEALKREQNEILSQFDSIMEATSRRAAVEDWYPRHGLYWADMDDDDGGFWEECFLVGSLSDAKDDANADFVEGNETGAVIAISLGGRNLTAKVNVGAEVIGRLNIARKYTDQLSAGQYLPDVVVERIDLQRKKLGLTMADPEAILDSAPITVADLLRREAQVGRNAAAATSQDVTGSQQLLAEFQQQREDDRRSWRRSQDAVEKAVKTVLKFARKILDEWPLFAEGYTRTRTTLVGLNAVLEAAALFVEGKAAAGLKDVAVSASVKAAKDALMTNPAAPKHVVTFFSACLVEHAAAMDKKRASASGSYTSKVPAIAMDFTPSPKKRKAKKAQIPDEYWAEAKDLARQINAIQQKFDDLGSNDFVDFLAWKRVEDKIGEHKEEAAKAAGDSMANKHSEEVSQMRREAMDVKLKLHLAEAIVNKVVHHAEGQLNHLRSEMTEFLKISGSVVAANVSSATDRNRDARPPANPPGDPTKATSVMPMVGYGHGRSVWPLSSGNGCSSTFIVSSLLAALLCLTTLARRVHVLNLIEDAQLIQLPLGPSSRHRVSQSDRSQLARLGARNLKPQDSQDRAQRSPVLMAPFFSWSSCLDLIHLRNGTVS